MAQRAPFALGIGTFVLGIDPWNGAKQKSRATGVCGGVGHMEPTNAVHNEGGMGWEGGVSTCAPCSEVGWA